MEKHQFYDCAHCQTNIQKETIKLFPLTLQDVLNGPFYEFWPLSCLNKNSLTIIIMFNICRVLTICRYCSKCYSCINSVILYKNSMRSVLILCPFYVCGNKQGMNK